MCLTANEKEDAFKKAPTLLSAAPTGKQLMVKTPLASLIWLLGLTNLCLGAQHSISVTPGSAETQWKFNYAGKPLMLYASDPHKYKPYVKELWTLEGENVLRDSPEDHLHHHALMYGIIVSGVNFWEEAPGAGVQKVIATAPKLGRTPRGLPSGTLEQELLWVRAADAFLPNTNSPALLVERRSITIAVEEPRRQVLLEWKSEFSVPAHGSNVVLSGAAYHGLGMRFQQHLDAQARHIHAAGAPDLAGGKQDVSAHDWEAVLLPSLRSPVAVALAGHPRNARGAAVFFSMSRPFTYISATQDLSREPLVYKAGERFQIRYLVLICPSDDAQSAISRGVGGWLDQGL